MIRTSRKLGGVAAIVIFVIALVVSLGASNGSGTRHEASSGKVILFASDGMRPADASGEVLRDILDQE